MVRAAGNSAQLMAKEGDFAQVRLPSGEVRMVRLECKATLVRWGTWIMRIFQSVKQDESVIWEYGLRYVVRP